MLIALAGLLLLGGVAVFERDLPIAEVDPRYITAASAFAELPNGARIHFRDEGRQDAPALILVHGSNASLQAWEPWVGLLGDTWRIVSLDLPGHGLTGRVPDDDYSIGAYVATVGAIADRLDIDQFALAGNSMGGGVAWQFALAHPERVSALILVNATGLWSWREQTRPPGSGSPVAFRLLGQDWFRGVARNVDPGLLIGQGLRASFHDPERVDDAMIERYRDLALRQGSRAATLIRFGGLRAAAGEAEPDLSRIEQPTLILWGCHDRLIPPEVGERFAATLPNARLVIYEDAGHLPMEEIPERSAADVRAFLSALP